MGYRYATDSNTIRWLVTLYKGTKKKIEASKTEIITWLIAEERFHSLSVRGVFCEIYRRLRKLPEFDGPVAVIFPQTVYSICSKYEMSPEEYEEEFNDLLRKEVISVIQDGGDFKVVTVDRSIFLTNALYYKESGTDAKACAEYFLTDYEKVDKTNKAG